MVRTLEGPRLEDGGQEVGKEACDTVEHASGARVGALALL